MEKLASGSKDGSSHGKKGGGATGTHGWNNHET